MNIQYLNQVSSGFHHFRRPVNLTFDMVEVLSSSNDLTPVKCAAIGSTLTKAIFTSIVPFNYFFLLFTNF